MCCAAWATLSPLHFRRPLTRHTLSPACDPTYPQKQGQEEPILSPTCDQLLALDVAQHRAPAAREAVDVPRVAAVLLVQLLLLLGRSGGGSGA